MYVITAVLTFGIVLIVAWVILGFRNPAGRRKVVFRTNVLILMSVAYFIVFGMFYFLVNGESNMPPAEVWNILEAPLMTLIGGTLAISKDLIQDDDASENKKPTDDGDDGNNGDRLAQQE